MKTRHTLIATAVSLALMSPAMAGVVADSNPTTGILGACGATDTETTACIGAWNLDNVKVQLFKLEDGSVFGEFFPDTGSYSTMIVGDSFVSNVYSGDPATTPLMAKLSGKVWPVGEPTGIKAVNNDTQVFTKKGDGTPENCLINTGYIDPYLDSATPDPVICSSGFQTHKRFKVAMQPATTEGVDTSAGNADGKPIDLVFNSTDDGTVKRYQVFSKINNYTGKRLAGFKIMVGTGLGTGFKAASADDATKGKLYITLGRDEEIKGSTTTTNLFEDDGLANFSHGLFGPIDLPNFPNPGFFSDQRAYYDVAQGCTTDVANCPTVPVTLTTDGTVGGNVVVNMMTSDMIYSDGVLSANYTNVTGTNPEVFGDWLPSIWAPKGIFFDDDNNPDTDPALMAWWDGTQWLKGQADAFAPATQTEVDAWLADPAYEEDVIEDLLNLGPNYIVSVGDIGTGQFTLRIIPVVAANQTAPAWAPPAPTDDTTNGGGGGGCVSTPNAPFSPTMPLLTLAALGGLFWRLRRKNAH